MSKMRKVTKKHAAVQLRQKAMKKNQEFFSKVNNALSMPLSIFIARRTRITPNQITLVSLVLGLLAGLALAISGSVERIFPGSFLSAYHLRILGALLAYAFFTLDGVDGKVARLTGTSSIVGKWWDIVTGHTSLSIIFLGLAVGIGTYAALALGFIAVLFYLVAYLQIACYKVEFGNLMEQKNVELIANRGRWTYLYGMSLFFPLLLVCAVIDYPLVPLIFYAFLGPLFYLAVLYFQHRAVKRL